MKSQEIRDKFIEFFSKKKHKPYPSSSLVPYNDSTLLFTNAGMNQFKDYFTGIAKAKDSKIVSIQKCVRAGGKHNDLENVGFTPRHHTFFEMLGNFSFGNYFKKEAIEYAWEFLTEILNIPKNKFYVTVHDSDKEAENIWKSMGLKSSNIFKKGDKDNFWEMGTYGPCGPCSEIYYDHGPKYSTKNFNGRDILEDENRYVEIWNLVFMQYERSKEGQKLLPTPCVDTGMGLERITAILQGVYWNYDTDIFKPIIKSIERLTNKKYNDKKYKNSIRVVADHIRASVMLITDGVIPSNEGKGYVLRRIIRRAIRHLRKLEAPKDSMNKLSDSVMDNLGKQYPQNKTNEEMAKSFLITEEKKFLDTLDVGIKYLEDAIKYMDNKILKGEIAFKLYDTYGFPIDLTEVILKERGLSINKAEFNNLMSQRQVDSKKSWKTTSNIDNKIFYNTKDQYGETRFVGYTEYSCLAKLLQKITLDSYDALIFDKTPFYGESGGQIGDSGVVLLKDKIICNILDTQKPIENLYIHICKDSNKLEVGKTYELKIDSKKRYATESNHSATHLLHAALRKILGNHINQAGSLVSFDRLRFDFTHNKSLSSEQIKKIEEMVNSEIKKSYKVGCSNMPIDKAMKKGAIALFGEKYSSEVRVLEMGDFSIELCGGTHVKNINDIIFFNIITETSLSSGIRRIEALTNKNSLDWLMHRSDVLKKLESKTSANDKLIVNKIESLLKEIKDQKKEINKLKDKINTINTSKIFDNYKTIKDFIFSSIEITDDYDLKKLSDIFVNKHKKGIVLFYTKPKKGNFKALLRTTKDFNEVNCKDMLQKSLALASGSGGGRVDMAQGSGNHNKLKEFVNYIKDSIRNI